MAKFVILLIFLFVRETCVTSYYNYQTKLSKYINNYEPLHHQFILLKPHQRTKLRFRAFGKHFNIDLFPGSRVLDANTKITTYGHNESTTISPEDVTQFLVRGRVNGISNSSVSGAITNGVFFGIIREPNETYFIELSERYFQIDVPFRSIIYRQSDINETTKFGNLSVVSGKRKRDVDDDYSDIENKTNDDTNVCTMRVSIEHTFYETFSSHTLGNIIMWVMVHLDATSDVFESTDFNMDGEPDGISLKVTEFIIWWSSELPDYKFYEKPQSTRLGMGQYLDIFSTIDSADVCISFLFTARYFGDNLGMAYQRKPSSPLQGICSPYNQAMITTSSEDMSYHAEIHLQPHESAFILRLIIHEIGHSFGAGHDPATGECSPGDGRGGNYIMNQKSQIVKTKHSHKFSPCSRREVSKMFKLFGKHCFVPESSITKCGNAYVDSEDEECDCGQIEQCDKVDPCCTPPGGIKDDKECTYRRSQGAQCSHREDRCCTSKCKIMTPAQNVQCNSEETCQVPSFCDGKNKECPESENVLDDTLCRGNFAYCQTGVCEDMVCTISKMNICTCSHNSSGQCELCCDKLGKCSPASVWGIRDTSGDKYHLPDGESCLSGEGICKSGKCELVQVPDTEHERGYRPINDKNRLREIKHPILYVHDFWSMFLIVVITCALIMVLGFAAITSYRYVRRNRRTYDVNANANANANANDETINR